VAPRYADVVIVSAFIIIQLSALSLLPFFPQQAQAFEDPGDPGNSVLYVSLFIFVSASILAVIALRMMFVLRLIMVSAMVAGASMTFALLIHIIITPAWLVLLSSLCMSVTLVVATMFTKDRRLMAITAGVLSVGAIVILGASLGPVPVLLLLAALSLYDYWAVRRTGHMQTIADGMAEAELPLLFRHVDDEGGETSIGLGDVVLPGILAASAMYHISPVNGTLPGSNVILALTIVLGGAAGLMLLLMRLDEKPAPGLPWINGGAILALAISYPLLFLL